MRATWLFRFAFGGLAAAAIAHGWQAGAQDRKRDAARTRQAASEAEESDEDASDSLLFDAPDEAPAEQLKLVKQGPAFQPRRSNQPARTSAPLDLSEDTTSSEPSIEERFASLVETETNAGAAETADSGQILAAAKPDLASSLSEEVDSLTSQVRQPISASPYIRGFRNGQIYGQLDGVYWSPARLDLDTILSKIDPGTVQSVNVIPGPYSSQFGPAFAFIDAYSIPTPRYDCPETHYQTNAAYLNNGRQWYGRETVFGGGSNYGYRLSYGHRTGVDYRAGNGRFIPSSYNNRDFRIDYGYDLNADQHLEFSYRHIDLTNAEYPGQFFDTNYLGVNSYSISLLDEDPFAPWTRARVNAWYNETGYNGDNSRASKDQADFPINPQIETALARQLSTNGRPDFNGITYGALGSVGARTAFTFGDLDDANLTVGADVRYLDHGITERFRVFDFGNLINTFNTNLPNSSMINPGLFGEIVLPTASYVRTAIGARADLVNTHVSTGTVNPLGYLATAYPGQDFSQDDALYAFYMTNRVELDENWAANMDFGHGQRPPSLIDRYSDGIFLGIIQNGFSRVFGNPYTKKERNWQMDVGLSGDYDYWRGSIRGFHSFIIDYITYAANPVSDPTSARQLFTLNTPSATLSGFEISNDFDLTENLTPFAQASYVYGHDQTIGQALPQIPPLQSRFGIQLHEGRRNPTWGLEMFARVVAQQGREGVLRSTGGGVLPVEIQTSGFTTVHLRGYWSVNRNLHLVSGIDNLFDRGYFEHLSLRLPGGNGFPPSGVYNPGFSPYFSMQWTY